MIIIKILYVYLHHEIVTIAKKWNINNIMVIQRCFPMLVA